MCCLFRVYLERFLSDANSYCDGAFSRCSLNWAPVQYEKLDAGKKESENQREAAQKQQRGCDFLFISLTQRHNSLGWGRGGWGRGEGGASTLIGISVSHRLSPHRLVYRAVFPYRQSEVLLLLLLFPKNLALPPRTNQQHK